MSSRPSTSFISWGRRCIAPAAKGGGAIASGSAAVGTLDLGGVRKIASFAPSAPAVEKAMAAELVVEVTGDSGTSTRGRWPCWLFPARAKRDGSDIAATGAMRAAVEAAFEGVLPWERAAEAKVVVADAGSPDVAAALARGQGVVEIGGLDGSLNIELGWWFHKDVVGATFDVESPLLRHLPESKSLSTLHFRIFKKGVEMPVKGFPADSLAVVSEEQASCRAHLGERVDAHGGRHVFAHGLALDQPLPEAVAILDGLVDRARERP